MLTSELTRATPQQLKVSGRFLVSSIAVGLAYFAMGKIGLLTAIANGTVTLIWPPTGIAFAAILMGGYRYWPSIAIGYFLLNYSTGAPLEFALATALGNPLPAIISLMILRRYTFFRHDLSRISDVTWFFGVAVVGSTTVSATIGTLGLVTSDLIQWSQASQVYEPGGWGMLWGFLSLAPSY